MKAITIEQAKAEGPAIVSEMMRRGLVSLKPAPTHAPGRPKEDPAVLAERRKAREKERSRARTLKRQIERMAAKQAEEDREREARAKTTRMILSSQNNHSGKGRERTERGRFVSASDVWRTPQ